MAKATGGGAASHLGAGPAQTPVSGPIAEEADDFVTSAVTVGAVVAGAALFEAALIPGIIVGAAAVLAPKYLPQIAAGLQPLVKYAIRGAYKIGQKTREVVAEAQEHVNDIVAEVNAEQEAAVATSNASADAAARPRS